MAQDAFLNDLRRRLVATREYLTHLDQQAGMLEHRHDEQALRRLIQIERDKRDVQIDIIRLESLLTTANSSVSAA